MQVGDLVRYKNSPGINSFRGIKNTLGIILDIKEKVVRIQWANHPLGPSASFHEENKDYLEAVK